ncbi:MAG: hypothetical protein JXB34_10550 [Bacteroidales bacterium]|nr:hypothetical protein [Bacteroidales bacterium]
MIIYESMDACIIYIESKNYAYLAIEGFIDSSKIKEFASKFTSLCLNKKGLKVIFDSSKITTVKNSDLQWIAENILPLLQNNDIQKIAFLSPESPFGQMAVQKFSKNITPGKAEVFHSMEQAENWIFQADSSKGTLLTTICKN